MRFLLLMLVSLGLSGCKAVAKLADVAGIQTRANFKTDLRAEANTILRDLGEVTESQIRQTTNDLVPFVVMVLGTVLFFMTAATVVICVLIRRHSYARQKPRYEARRLAGSLTSTRKGGTIDGDACAV